MFIDRQTSIKTNKYSKEAYYNFHKIYVIVKTNYYKNNFNSQIL